MNEKWKTPDERELIVSMMLSALGNEVRLRIYRLLVRAGHDGLPVGSIQERLGIAPSTLSHHLAALKQSDLISQRRQGREILSYANYESMQELLDYLTEECCADEAGEETT